MQLNPQENFVIARGLEDHTISTTFYVRATIRNGRTDELIDTVDLVDSGDHRRYTKTWRVPADPSGQGFYIIVTTSVYTDSGYTTKSTDYADRYDTYLVMERYNPSLSGHGGGADIDYKKIQKMIVESINAIPKAELPEKIDLDPMIDRIDQKIGQVMSSVTSLKSICESIAGKEFPNTDLSPVISKLKEIESKIKMDEAMELNAGALKDIRDSIIQSLQNDQNKLKETIDAVEMLLERIRDFFGPEVDGIVNGIDELKAEFKKINHVTVLDRRDQETD